MYRITTKQKNYNEVLGSLRFVDGVAQTDDKWMAEWCRGRGFTVEKIEPETKGEPSLDTKSKAEAGKSAKPKTQKGKKQDDEGNAASETDNVAAEGTAAGD